jgi:hypothetical protein
MTIEHALAVIAAWILIFMGGLTIMLSMHVGSPLMGVGIPFVVASLLAGKIDRHYSE